MTAPARPVLTDRQQKVLRLRAEGFRRVDIAEALHLAVGTVDYHERVIVSGFNARNITHAVFLACRAGILDGRPRRHGDHAGYEAHRRRGEDPRDCPHGCWQGELAHKARLRAARTQERPSGAPGAPGPSRAASKPR